MNCTTCGAALRLEADKPYLYCDYCRHQHFPDPDADGIRDLDAASRQKCPVCRETLVHAAAGDERVLFCRKCRGLLVNMDVFVAMVEELRSQSKHPPGRPGRTPLKDLNRRIDCPYCRKRMHTHPYGGPGNIVIDNCPNCRMNWLDHQELRRIVRAPDASPGEKLWVAP